MHAHIGDKDNETDFMKNEAHLCMMQERLMQMGRFLVISKVQQVSMMKILQTSHRFIGGQA